MLFGIVPEKWIEQQYSYLLSKKRKILELAWFSKFIRSLWDMQNRMWLHRYTFFHNTNKGVHIKEQQAIDNSLLIKLTIGLNRLSNKYKSLFKYKNQELLKVSYDIKLLQLDSVQAERDRLRNIIGLDLWFKDPLAATFLERDKVRRKGQGMNGQNLDFSLFILYIFYIL